MTITRMIELLEIEHECMLRKSHDSCDGDCADCDLVQDDAELHEMYTDVLALLKEQKQVKAMKLAVPFTRTKPIEFDYSCPVCMVGLMNHWTACPTCGTKVIF